MIKVKQYSYLTNNTNNIKITDLYDITPTTKYLYLNLLGDNFNMYNYYGGSIIGNKSVPKSYLFPRVESSTVLFELKNGIYTNSTYGNLTDILISPPTNLNYINLVSIGLSDKVDPGLLFAANLPSSFVGELTNQQYSCSIVNTTSKVTTSTANNLVKNALSYVDKVWTLQSDWQFVDLIASLTGASLPLSSINDYNKTSNNSIWNVEYDGNNPSGNWKSLISPGDIIFLSDKIGNSSASICVSGYGSNANIINTSSKYNKILNSEQIKIASPHLISDEYLYNNVSNDNVFIYSLGNYIENSVSNNSSTTSNITYKPATYSNIQITPKQDFKYCTNQPIKISVNDIFSVMNTNSKITLKINNLPPWLKFNSITNELTGTSPNNNTTANISIDANYGTQKANDVFNITIDKKILADIKDAKWMAGTVNYLSINKGTSDKYYYSVTSAHNLDWIKIDQQTGKLYGLPPLEEIGHSYKLTVYQQYNNANYNVDDFTLNITYPINIVGVSESTDYQFY